MPAPWRRKLTFAAVAGLYLLLLAAVVGGGLYARSWAISVYGSPQAQSQWDEWRAGAAKLSTQGPVKRRVPQSDKPPALILATTYFGVCLSIAIVLSTVLFATGVYLIQGVLRSRLRDVTSSDHMVHRQRSN